MSFMHVELQGHQANDINCQLNADFLLSVERHRGHCQNRAAAAQMEVCRSIEISA
jgi:hypothetical protein